MGFFIGENEQSKNGNDNKNKLLIRCGGSPKNQKTAENRDTKPPWLRQSRREYLLPENTQRVINICFYLLEFSFYNVKKTLIRWRKCERLKQIAKRIATVTADLMP